MNQCWIDQIVRILWGHGYPQFLHLRMQVVRFMVEQLSAFEAEGITGPAKTLRIAKRCSISVLIGVHILAYHT